MNEEEVKVFLAKAEELISRVAALSVVAPEVRKAMQPLVNQIAIAQTEARVEAMLHARGRGLADADCLTLAQEVRFLPL